MMEGKKITKRDIYLFLKQNKSAVISTVNLENMPEGALIYYGVDKDFNFYFVTGDKTRKYANIKRNPKAALTISDEYMLTTIQIEGSVEEVHSVKKNSNSVKLLTEVLSPTIRETIAHIWDPIPPILKMENGKIVIFKIKPYWLRYANFSESDEKAKGNYFKLIIP
jgi:uncharacterized pyridoxamine 5'-phosphate oxidase family protein